MAQIGALPARNGAKLIHFPHTSACGSGRAVDACGVCGGINLCKIDTATITLGGRRGDHMEVGAGAAIGNGSAWRAADRTVPTEGPGGIGDWEEETQESSASTKGVAGWRCLWVALVALAWALVAVLPA